MYTVDYLAITFILYYAELTKALTYHSPPTSYYRLPWAASCDGNRHSGHPCPNFSFVIFQNFFIDIKSFRSHCGPGVNSASNRNEYQEYFLVGKGGRCIRLTTLSPSCAAVMKSGNLNFLEPSGQPQACNGTDLPLHIIYINNWGPQWHSG
jgi:hypothetical protein